MLPVRVLVTDDTNSMRKAIIRFLSAESTIAVCGEARDLAELFTILKDAAPHIVLLDVHLPDERLFTIAHIKEQLSGTSVLAMSVWNDQDTADFAKEMGAVKLLDKGTLSETLMQAIEECVQKRPVLDS